eukprot:EG_transcript_6220
MVSAFDHLRKEHVVAALILGVIGATWYAHRRNIGYRRRDFLADHQDAKAAFVVVDSIVRKLLCNKALGLSYGEMLVGLSVLMHECVSVPSTRRPCLQLGLAQEAVHFMRFASGAYGWKLLNDLFYEDKAAVALQSVLNAEAANLDMLLQHVPGLAREDVVGADWAGSIFRPCYFIVWDHRTESIVVSVRGTLSTHDIITDIVAEYAPYEIGPVKGFAHRGILQGAMALANDLLPLLLEATALRPGYRVVFTGHSLGAGISALLTLHLRRTTALRPVCYAFAPPCVLSPSLAVAAKQYGIHSFVLQGDFVCRLSVGSILDLKHVVKGIITRTDGPLHRLLVVLKKSESPLARLSIFEDVCRTLDYDVDLDLSKLVVDEHEKLLPPGNVYQLYYPPNGHPRDSRLEEAEPRHFRQLLVTQRMFRDHLPHNYELALKGAVRRLCKDCEEPPSPLDATTEESMASAVFSTQDWSLPYESLSQPLGQTAGAPPAPVSHRDAQRVVADVEAVTPAAPIVGAP